MDGILLVDKPKGWSSFDVIRKLRRVTGVKKIGHAGTLDPMATGLLITLFGSATKQADQFLKLDKVYDAEITLAKVSSTDDAEGELHPLGLGEQTIPSPAEIKQALKSFIGKVQQLPPRFSAIKVRGQRAYKLARRGGEVQLEPRAVEIHEIKLGEYKYPKLRLQVHVGSGTYIRSLARDLGERLGTGAYLSGLRRTSIGEFLLKDAVNGEKVSADTVKRRLQLN